MKRLIWPLDNSHPLRTSVSNVAQLLVSDVERHYFQPPLQGEGFIFGYYIPFFFFFHFFNII